MQWKAKWRNFKRGKCCFRHLISDTPDGTPIINVSKAIQPKSKSSSNTDVCFFVCVFFCFVNVQRHKTSSSPHVSFLCTCRYRVKVVWLSFNRLTTGSLRLNSAQLNSLSWKSCQSRSPAEEALIHPVEALRILNGNVKFFPQLLERFVWRQIQSIEAVKSNTDIIKSIDE